MEQAFWGHFAYCTRYGHQPLSELRALTIDELASYGLALERLVEKENGPAK